MFIPIINYLNELCGLKFKNIPRKRREKKKKEHHARERWYAYLTLFYCIIYIILTYFEELRDTSKESMI